MDVIGNVGKFTGMVLGGLFMGYIAYYIYLKYAKGEKDV